MTPPDCVALRDRWVTMIDRVYDELTDLMWQREQIRMVGKMIDENPQLLKNAKPFLWEVRRWYMVFAAMAVRRQTDRGDKLVSLTQLLTEMRQHPRCISRDLHVERFRELYPNGDEFFESAIVDGLWDKWRDSSGDLSVERLDADLLSLAQESKIVYAFASSTLAHTSKNAIGKDFNLTFNDLDAVIDNLERLTIDYYALLTGRGCNTLLPTPQFDWHQQFTFAWKTPNKNDRV